MASRGSNKDLSVRHENHIAFLFDGIRSRSSGAAVTDPGDVRCQRLLIECKMTKSTRPECPKVFLKELEKVAQEAWEHGQDPMVALRYFNPQSMLADREGWIDLTVRLAEDDAVREVGYNAGVQNDKESEASTGC